MRTILVTDAAGITSLINVAHIIRVTQIDDALIEVLLVGGELLTIRGNLQTFNNYMNNARNY